MKRFVLFVAAGLAFTALKAQAPTEVVKFETEVHDFGKIKQGVPVKYDFVFKNVSRVPVTVETATASCGCTTPDWPKAPILPGKSDKINAGYNAANMGRFEKTITVKLQGIESTVMLKITGEVVAEGVDGAPATNELVKTVDVTAPVAAPVRVKTATPVKAVTAKTAKKTAKPVKKTTT